MQFQTGLLSNHILQLEQDRFTGAVNLTTDLGSEGKITKVIAFWEGAITFMGDRLPSPPEFANFIKQKLNVTFMDSALKVLESRVKKPDSVRELVDFINRFGLFKWEDLEPVMEKEIALQLEMLLTCAGELEFNPEASFDLSYGHDCHGFSWDALQKILVKRQKGWQALLPITPSSIFSRSLGSSELPEETQQHLETWVNGQRSLLQISSQTNVDPLELAFRYSKLLKQDWISLPNTTAKGSENSQRASVIHRPIVLSVDDSPIVQVSIQRAIGDRYEVLCAKSAVEALNLLNTRKVELILLDVTMPEIDGLELCRTIRSIGKFRDLPVIMLTAKDGLIDKVKGQFAGATQYLTKPMDREKLLPVLEKYISVKEAAT